MVQVCWLSVNPCSNKIVFYPKEIAIRIEQAYINHNPDVICTCILGADFFNTTVHFHPNGSCYQTTLGFSMGGGRFKQSGYRSVKRVIINPNNDYVTVCTKEIYGDWRITRNEDVLSAVRFDVTIPSEYIIEDITTVVDKFNAWTASDLISDTDTGDRFVVWEWCRGVPERQGNLMLLSDDWWVPYLCNENTIIEEAFLLNMNSIDIEIPNNGSRTIVFKQGSFALQKDIINRKQRTVRRVTKTIQELKKHFNDIMLPPLDIFNLIDKLPPEIIPQGFYCCITQDIMKEPVQTVDGHIYEKTAIQRWFQHNTTSPLTGLILSSTSIRPQVQLQKRIEKFVLNNAHNAQNPPTLE